MPEVIHDLMRWWDHHQPPRGPHVQQGRGESTTYRTGQNGAPPEPPCLFHPASQNAGFTPRFWPSPATTRKCSLLSTTPSKLRQPGLTTQGRSFPFFNVPTRTAPSETSAPATGDPSQWNGKTSVTSTANCAPNRGRPSSTISILRPPVSWSPERLLRGTLWLQHDSSQASTSSL